MNYSFAARADKVLEAARIEAEEMAAAARELREQVRAIREASLEQAAAILNDLEREIVEGCNEFQERLDYVAMVFVPRSDRPAETLDPAKVVRQPVTAVPYSPMPAPATAAQAVPEPVNHGSNGFVVPPAKPSEAPPPPAPPPVPAVQKQANNEPIDEPLDDEDDDASDYLTALQRAAQSEEASAPKPPAKKPPPPGLRQARSVKKK